MKKTKKFSHLSKSERDEIAILKKKKYSLRDIARVLNRSPNSIPTEVLRNRVKEIYDSKKAELKARVRRRYAKYQGMKIVEHAAEIGWLDAGTKNMIIGLPLTNTAVLFGLAILTWIGAVMARKIQK